MAIKWVILLVLTNDLLIFATWKLYGYIRIRRPRREFVKALAPLVRAALNQPDCVKGIFEPEPVQVIELENGIAIGTESVLKRIAGAEFD